jgi:hypothetical protein
MAKVNIRAEALIRRGASRLSKKSTTSPLTVPSGVLLLKEEEKVNTLLIFTFPSFVKGADR